MADSGVFFVAAVVVVRGWLRCERRRPLFAQSTRLCRFTAAAAAAVGRIATTRFIFVVECNVCERASVLVLCYFCRRLE